jgi:hypothetical protein
MRPDQGIVEILLWLMKSTPLTPRPRQSESGKTGFLSLFVPRIENN